MSTRSAAQVFALVIGLALVAVGIAGFFCNASFGTGHGASRGTLLGILAVNGWHNVLHIASGVVSLAVVGSWGGARAYALGLGVAYALLAVAGFIAGSGHEIFSLVPVNTEDNVLHVAIALAGLAAGQATPVEPPPTAAAA